MNRLAIGLLALAILLAAPVPAKAGSAAAVGAAAKLVVRVVAKVGPKLAVRSAKFGNRIVRLAGRRARFAAKSPRDVVRLGRRSAKREVPDGVDHVVAVADELSQRHRVHEQSGAIAEPVRYRWLKSHSDLGKYTVERGVRVRLAGTQNWRQVRAVVDDPAAGPLNGAGGLIGPWSLSKRPVR